MQRYALAGLVLAVATATGACNRDQDKMETTAESRAQSAQLASMPTTVQGCLKAGEAEDTFVLTTARTEGSGETATYQLVGDQTNALREHVGHRVEISGTLQTQQEIAGSTTAKPADEEATGTSGTPTVRTRSELDIRRMSVTAVKPLEGECQE